MHYLFLHKYLETALPFWKYPSPYCFLMSRGSLFQMSSFSFIIFAGLDNGVLNSPGWMQQTLSPKAFISLLQRKHNDSITLHIITNAVGFFSVPTLSFLCLHGTPAHKYCEVCPWLWTFSLLSLSERGRNFLTGFTEWEHAWAVTVQ